MPKPITYPPLEQVTRTHVLTADTAYYLSLEPQTLREKYMKGTYDVRLKPIKVGGRIMWSVKGLWQIFGITST